MSDLASRQRQTANGRRAFLDKFPSPEARSEHFRNLARRAAGSRVVLSAADAAVLITAHELIGRVADKARCAKADEEVGDA